ncbi:phage GP46 family protein [Hydrocarboniphaga effusa]|uniref:phage GP46 family protein n=1 Tax=Hydrocarboniphaga effusa TaxID=243629 RepID=UPI003BA8A4A5
MTDLALQILDDGSFDLEVCCNDLATTDGLESAVAISLFTNARAPDDFALPLGADRGGCWMDSYPDIEGDEMGSLLWLLSREKQTDETRQRAERYARNALQWLLDDRVASAVSIVASYPSIGLMALAIEITDARGSRRSFAFALDRAGSLCKCPPLWPFDDNAQQPGGVTNSLTVIGE